MKLGQTHTVQTILLLLCEVLSTDCCNLTILEGEKLKDAVHNGDNDGESQQVWIGFQEGHLHKEFIVKLSLLIKQ